ncbi:hypothetical protein [uncultured Treponema sp.]|uniref:hypothetical protein n=1 Tax=uncultured Treponema sp. TaxID=162155 RepID=UPI0025E94C3D|nr:hypothetical protein [uncultured Treponema sp.]
MNLTGVWKCQDDRGIYILNQNDKDVFIHGFGVGDERHENIGRGVILDDEKTLLVEWSDTYVSPYQENRLTHICEIQIIDSSHTKHLKILAGASPKNPLKYGTWEKIYDFDTIGQQVFNGK